MVYVCFLGACSDAETLQQRAERRSGAEALQAFAAAIVSKPLHPFLRSPLFVSNKSLSKLSSHSESASSCINIIRTM
jgi:hypothetical protein